MKNLYFGLGGGIERFGRPINSMKIADEHGVMKEDRQWTQKGKVLKFEDNSDIMFPWLGFVGMTLPYDQTWKLNAEFYLGGSGLFAIYRGGLKVLAQHSTGFGIGGGIEGVIYPKAYQKVGDLKCILSTTKTTASGAEEKGDFLSYSKFYIFGSACYTKKLFETEQQSHLLRFEVQGLIGGGYSTPNIVVSKVDGSDPKETGGKSILHQIDYGAHRVVRGVISYILMH